MIRTFEHDFPTETLPDFLARHGCISLPAATASTAIPAYINHGRWVVDCPFCSSAQMVSEQDPKFYCVDCKNAGVDGKWLPVLFPKDRVAIEGALMERPEHVTRNWRHGETVKDLKRENAQRGL